MRAVDFSGRARTNPLIAKLIAAVALGTNIISSAWAPIRLATSFLACSVRLRASAPILLLLEALPGYSARALAISANTSGSRRVVALASRSIVVFIVLVYLSFDAERLINSSDSIFVGRGSPDYPN